MDYVISIEKAVAFLKEVIIGKTPEVIWWDMRVEG